MEWEEGCILCIRKGEEEEEAERLVFPQRKSSAVQTKIEVIRQLQKQLGTERQAHTLLEHQGERIGKLVCAFATLSSSKLPSPALSWFSLSTTSHYSDPHHCLSHRFMAVGTVSPRPSHPHLTQRPRKHTLRSPWQAVSPPYASRCVILPRERTT